MHLRWHASLCLLLLFVLRPAPTIGQESESTATLTGTIRSATTDAPLRDVSVVLRGAEREVLTDSAGRFTLDGVRPGADTLQVRLIGFAEERVPIGLAPGHVTRVALLLSEMVLRVEEIEVTVRRPESRGRLSGFYERRRTGPGVFLGPEEIAESHAMRPSDLLRRVPGVRIGSRRTGRTSITIQRGQRPCEPFVYVDGIPARDYHIDDLSPHDLLGLEIYRGSSETPARFKFRGGQCATLVIWTREGRPGERDH